MLNWKKAAGITAAAVVFSNISGCGNLQTVRSFSTPYEQPTSGDRARIRVISFGGMIRAVPNSSCVDWRLPGAGVMVVSTKGFANMNDRDLGMPIGKFPGLTTAMGAVAVSELYVEAGKPIVLDYISQGQKNFQCFASISFVPVVGEDYEAAYTQNGKFCRLSITRLTESDKTDRSTSVAFSEASLCRVSDKF
jgi:hypothetical protein